MLLDYATPGSVSRTELLLRRARQFARRWTVPAVLIVIVALIMAAWAAYIITESYERAVNVKVAMLAQRVRIHTLQTPSHPSRPTAMVPGVPVYWPLPAPQPLDSIRTELLGDPSVQAVVYMDEGRNSVWSVRRHETVAAPRSYEEAMRMLTADPSSYRAVVQWDQSNSRRVVYVDLSRAELQQHFYDAYGPLLRKILILTVVGFVLLSLVCIFAYQLWGRASRQRQLAELEQQGMLAERVLTAAVLAHEIRNPLTALGFQLEGLRRHSDEPGRVEKTTDTIRSEVQRIQRLVEDYLAHEKAQAMRASNVNLAEAVQTLLGIMGELLRQSGTRVTVQQIEAGITVACDEHALRQVLMNLVLNAQQAMGQGGSISIQIGREDGYGTIRVADTGPGIPPELLDRLFKPFNTTRRGGTGIGLALVKRFVDNFGGSVSVQSEPGKGAVFLLKLPLAQRALKAAAEPAPAQATASG